MPILEYLEEEFTNTQLYHQALTHESWVNEHPGVRGNYERLEFLGDSVLGFIVADHLYEKFPDMQEGDLTPLKSAIVDNKNLAIVAEKLEVGPDLYLGEGEISTGGRSKEKILSSALEAIIGALWLDRGLEVVQKFIGKNILVDLPETTTIPGHILNPKGTLQEYLQKAGMEVPDYRVVHEEGPDHCKSFSVEVFIDGVPFGKGEGDSKQKAEFSAAQDALKKLESE